MGPKTWDRKHGPMALLETVKASGSHPFVQGTGPTVSDAGFMGHNTSSFNWWAVLDSNP